VQGSQLAEVNVAKLRHPLNDPRMSGFREAIARVNLLAEDAPGFVWRLAAVGGHLAGDDLLAMPGTIVNVSVWQDYESLHAFTYRGLHGHYLNDRARWFEPVTGTHTALWWVPAGNQPTAEDAVAHLRYLRRWGPSPRAFTVLHRYAADGSRVR
jgi:Domain of unknown function (DUF3291)